MSCKVSIITPSFNQGKFIERTIQSVLNQGTDTEYLIVDGGSTDETMGIIQKYAKYLDWISEKDEGQTDAVNKGIKSTKAPIIGWLNSDDVYYPGTIQTVIETFDMYPEIDVIYGNADHIDENDKYLEDYYTEEWNYERLKEVCYICQPAVFFRRSVIEQYSYLDINLKYCMDYEFWLRIGRTKPFYYLPKKFAGSRLYSTNKTLGNRKAVHEEIITMIKKKFGSTPSRWIYNLAHVVAEEKGIDRSNPSENYRFVKMVVLWSFYYFIKYQGYIKRQDIRHMFGWLKDTKPK